MCVIRKLDIVDCIIMMYIKYFFATFIINTDIIQIRNAILKKSIFMLVKNKFT